MLIDNADGQVLVSAVISWLTAQPGTAYSNGVWVALAYSIIAPDDRVEWDLFMYPDEVHTAPFLSSFQPVVQVLDTRAQFTPHYRIIDGETHGWSVRGKRQHA
jgi:hypothetical protein